MAFSSVAKSASDKSFGLLFALIFSLIGIYSIYKSWYWIAEVTLFITSALCFIVALTAPNLLSPFNKAWLMLGLLLGKIANPIVLGAIFFILITPVAVISRYLGRDQLRLRMQNVDSYWVKRESIGLDAESFKNQF